jgi:hypothetical protein
VTLRDVHESRQQRAEALHDVHNLRVVQTSERVKSYEGNPDGKNLDGDVALLEQIEDEFSGVRAARDRDDEPVKVDKPAVVTTKCVREVLERDDRLDGVADAWENYGNMKGSNKLGERNLAALLGCQHYGDDSVERFAALGGEEVTRVGYGDELEYNSGVADEYLGHMREDQVMQAVLRFARGGSGAVVFAHTAALRDDLPVVGKGEVIRSWSEGATEVARQIQRTRGEEFEVGDISGDVGVCKRSVRRILDEFTNAGYVEKRETAVGRANAFTAVDSPGAGEVEISAEVDAAAVGEADAADSNTVYTANVRVVDIRDGSLPSSRPSGSTLPAPDGHEEGLAEGDPPE